MKRRTALKLLGGLIACTAGRPILAITELSDVDPEASLQLGPVDYFFCEEGIRNIIIRHKSGKDTIIPFSEIVKALEEEKY